MPGSFRLGSIAGIAIGIHYTWLLAFVLISWSLAAGFFPQLFPGFDRATYWTIGVASALLLFTSVLVHELSHSFMALARGLRVESITLFIFGGVSNIATEAEEPRDEFLVAIVGPLTSFALAAGFYGLYLLLEPAPPLTGTASPLGAVLAYLALINLLLGAFNMLPGFPLDGGRVLRSLIWGVTRSLRRATQIASYVGQGFGFLLMFVGVAQIFAGNFLGGLWIGFIGWFLNNAAETSRQQQAVQEGLRGIRVTELMDSQPPITEPDLSVRDFVFEHVLRHGRRALIVVDRGGLAGIVSIVDVKELPQDGWERTPVERIMTRAPLKTVTPDSDLSQALRVMVEGNLNQTPVVADGRVVGMLSRSDVLRFLQLREELGVELRRGRPARRS